MSLNSIITKFEERLDKVMASIAVDDLERNVRVLKTLYQCKGIDNASRQSVAWYTSPSPKVPCD